MQCLAHILKPKFECHYKSLDPRSGTRSYARRQLANTHSDSNKLSSPQRFLHAEPALAFPQQTPRPGEGPLLREAETQPKFHVSNVPWVLRTRRLQTQWQETDLILQDVDSLQPRSATSPLMHFFPMHHSLQHSHPFHTHLLLMLLRASDAEVRVRSAFSSEIWHGIRYHSIHLTRCTSFKDSATIQYIRCSASATCIRVRNYSLKNLLILHATNASATDPRCPLCTISALVLHSHILCALHRHVNWHTELQKGSEISSDRIASISSWKPSGSKPANCTACIPASRPANHARRCKKW